MASSANPEPARRPGAPPADKSFHYTAPTMARDLVALLPLSGIVLDAGSGLNKVWFNALNHPKCECEIDNGCNFYEWSERVAWVVGNPPYHESWKFTEKAITVADLGVAWLLNNQALNSHLTPARLQFLHDRGWHYTNIHVVADRRWFGRYYLLVLQRGDRGFCSWNRSTY
jgi:hypothetical protein